MTKPSKKGPKPAVDESSKAEWPIRTMNAAAAPHAMLVLTVSVSSPPEGQYVDETVLIQLDDLEEHMRPDEVALLRSVCVFAAESVAGPFLASVQASIVGYELGEADWPILGGGIPTMCTDDAPTYRECGLRRGVVQAPSGGPHMSREIQRIGPIAATAAAQDGE